MQVYDKTVLFKAEKRTNSPGYALYYSRVFKHTKKVNISSDEPINGIRLRLGLLFLCHKASASASDWPINGSKINEKSWFFSSRLPNLGEEATPRKGVGNAQRIPDGRLVIAPDPDGDQRLFHKTVGYGKGSSHVDSAISNASDEDLFSLIEDLHYEDAPEQASGEAFSSTHTS
ncbi:hypothetical protein P154DRAFT_569944 [Amniculicola lignicola CBS 123094]|uniref:Uncharacterized protein n=1 Tax=Amniculicola lignicola CBS 123094 TaxID=1392246 RepID=A0A6A5WY74_9PLEO|nr:hypothetical protein P154DRAFT_569944 [Amniculicola lignicola CBS 123094]